jgi:hypothetical protein
LKGKTNATRGIGYACINGLAWEKLRERVNEESIGRCAACNRSGTQNSGKTQDECRVVAHGGTFASKGSIKDLRKCNTSEENKVSREKRNRSGNSGRPTRFSLFSFVSPGTIGISLVLAVPQRPSGQHPHPPPTQHPGRR